MQNVVDSILALLPTTPILLEPTNGIIASLDEETIRKVSKAFEELCVDVSDRDCFLTIAVDTKRGFYLDAWIPELSNFLEILERKKYLRMRVSERYIRCHDNSRTDSCAENRVWTLY